MEDKIQMKLLRCSHTELQLLDELLKTSKKKKKAFFLPLV